MSFRVTSRRDRAIEKKKKNLKKNKTKQTDGGIDATGLIARPQQILVLFIGTR